MRKWFTFIVVSAFTMLLVACGTASDGSENQPPLENEEPVEQESEQVENEQNEGVEDNEQKENNQKIEQINPDNEDEKTTSNEEDTGQLEYDEFELDIEYPNDKDYEIKLENHRGGDSDAKIDDEVNGIKIEGPEAYNELYPLVKQLTITSETTKEEAIQEIIRVFELDPNYEKFEVEITFTNGSEIEFKD